MSSTPAAVGLRSERGPILLSVMVSTGLVAIDSTVVATAVPSIVADIGGYAAFPWLFSIYLLAQAVLTPVYSKLADQLGRKPVLLFGIAVFLIGSLLCGVAWDMPSLIVFRAVQGIGAGAIMPMTVVIVGDIYSVEERARVQGYLASVWGVSSVVGPTLGGLFSQLDIWRWIFLINIPLCLLAYWLLARNYRESHERRRHRIDWAGAALLTSGLTLLLLGVLEGGVAWAWDSAISIGVLSGGAVLILLFVLVERRAAEPILPLWIFTRPVVASTSVLNLLLGGVLIGYTACIPAYLEGSVGATPLLAGLALATLTLGWPVAAAVSGRLYLRFGFRPVIIAGTALVLAAAAAVAALSAWPSIWVVAGVLFVAGLGFGFTAVPSLVAVQSSVAWEERGVASGALMFSRSIGQAVLAGALGALSNGIIAQLGGDERDPSTVIASSGAVFLASAICAVAMFGLAFAVPRSRAVAEPTA
ncbi:MFS transporter [Microbacterium marinilacus]|uniref:MDR family MFS transporter n=1 Tax=Microbacterium marinilacus TaxID=415209 RepID=A0ABP7BF74_9MICO|nr:MFS transporter [Microbacterium marinilacus]MBY0689593.1 MFS transporter [Microbacterium marinilacus]